MEMVFVNQDWIDRSDTYNITIGGNAPPHGDEWSKIVSEKNRGRKVSDETKRKLSLANIGKQSGAKGKKWSEESRQRLSIAKKGKHLSEEAKKRMSDASRGRKNRLGMKWYNNGTISRGFRGEPPAGWVKGRIFNKKRNKK